jgi:hypothetical protein
VMKSLPRLLSCSTAPSLWFPASLSRLLRTRRRQTASCSSSAPLWTPQRRLLSSTIVPLPPQLRIRFIRRCFMPAMCLCDGTPPSRRWPRPMTALYLVLERSPHTFRLQLGDKTDVVATARLKAAILPLDATAAEPRRRGRPAHGRSLLPAAPSVPARSSIHRAPSGPPKRVTFATAFDVAPEGRPQRLRRPPDRFSVSSLGSETWGEV